MAESDREMQMHREVQPQTRGMQGMQGMQAAHPQTGDETKPSLRTTEFYIYLAAVAGVLLASLLVDRNRAGDDIFRADQAWWFISLLTIGYLISRGLAKAGSLHRSGA